MRNSNNSTKQGEIRNTEQQAVSKPYKSNKVKTNEIKTRN